MTNLFLVFISSIYLLLPINSSNRNDISSIQLTKIGNFGEWRKERPGVPAHHHTGIDIMRPTKNYENEPIFPIANGKVISVRTDGPYAQIIIEHWLNGITVWTLYEHIAGVRVSVNDNVTPQKPIARFMNRNELDKYGWQFDHFHLEVMKVKPQQIKPTLKHPERFFNAYSLVCFTSNDLNRYYFDPLDFLKEHV
jgi:murein DD-endopeptidase MepM/ murein hydrolase activator NlpD